MDGCSIQFHFAHPCLLEYLGAQVKLHFNPFAPDCTAALVLAADHHGQRAGTILGHADQINRHARYTRRAFGYGLDPDIGAAKAKQHAQNLRRSIIAIRPDGKPGVTHHETRNFNPDPRAILEGAAPSAPPRHLEGAAPSAPTSRLSRPGGERSESPDLAVSNRLPRRGVTADELAEFDL
jgi:hypothetical protein